MLKRRYSERRDRMTKTIGDGNGGASIHILLQGKGGVGKSLISAILSQYLISKGLDVHGIDADPVNQTLSEYRGLAVSCLNLLKEGSVDQREFDLLMERFLTESGTFVVDTGASTFIPLWHYILENHALDYLRERGKRVFVHSVITGGQALTDTLAGFEQLAETTREKNIVIWLNEYFGAVLPEGLLFRDMAVCRKHLDKVHGAVAIVRRTADTFGRDVEEMVSQKMTFDEAVNGSGFTIMAKQRLRVVQRDLFEQLDAIPFV
jgi:CobQ/CobB/MinD/ParA nucleotide binding domain